EQLRIALEISGQEAAKVAARAEKAKAAARAAGGAAARAAKRAAAAIRAEAEAGPGPGTAAAIRAEVDAERKNDCACAICHEVVKNNEENTNRFFKCEMPHPDKFHRMCLESWINTSNNRTCPTCRAGLK
ncbi:hypothetical protein, partial [Candidatus Cardinium hertigii]